MRKHNRLVLLIAFLLSHMVFLRAQEQESRLSLVDTAQVAEPVTEAFKSPRVINNHSMEMLAPGALDFRILHRFGDISQGFQQFFGLDQATMRLGFDYGVCSNMSIGVGRSSLKKEVDGYIKYRILQQTRGGKKNKLVSILWVSGLTINGELNPFIGTDVPNHLTNRMAYFHEIIVGRKINRWLTMQLSPMWLHQNVVASTNFPNDLFALGLGGRLKVSQRVALVCDFAYLLNRFPDTKFAYPLSLGVDIDTGGHVFQLHLTNASGLNERAFLADQNSSWPKGNIKLGFNLSRVFQVRKVKQ